MTGRSWDGRSGLSDEREFRADVYVFAVQICTNHADYDMLDVGQWEFYVLPSSILKENGARSVGITFLKKNAGEAVNWEMLKERVEQAYEEKRS